MGQPQQQQMMQAAQQQQQPRYRSVQLQPQQLQVQKQPNQFGGFQQPAPPYPWGMQPQQQGGQYLPNMMHQIPQSMNQMGPQSSVSMTAQQMLAQVRSLPQHIVRSPGPWGPPGMGMGMPSPQMQQSPP